MVVEALVSFEQRFRVFLQALETADVAHDLNHIFRVVKVAKQLAVEEGAELDVVVPAAWLHDCVSLPKNHPQRAFASRMAADKAVAFLRSIDYPECFLEAIHHCICAHSFSAQITPKTIEAEIVQDADRLDALGAIGVARCMQVSGALNRALYHTDDPFCESRPLDDKHYSIDHFFVKLFNISDSLKTAAARREGKRRESFMRQFLTQLEEEI